MNSPEKNMRNASSEQGIDTPPTKGGTQKIHSTEVDRLKIFSQKIIDAIGDIPTKNIPRKIALFALTIGALHISSEKVFGAELNAALESQPPAATESASHAREMNSPEMSPLEIHPPEYTYTRQKQLIDRLFIDEEIVIPIIEKQGLILTDMSIEGRNTIIHFDELRNGAYTASVIIRPVDENTIEVRVYNSDDTIDLIRFRDGNVISATTGKQ